MNKLLKILVFLTILGGCSKKDDKGPVVAAPGIPSIVSITGQGIQLKTSDNEALASTGLILLSDSTIIPNGTNFRIISENLFISLNQVDWIRDTIVQSNNGVVQFYVRPNTTPGLYRVNVFPVENPSFKFTPGTMGRFFIDVLPGTPTAIQLISAEVFEDLTPYNGTKQLNEPWIISADSNLITYISVGPISDAYGNFVSEGSIELSVGSGTLVSPNPVAISNGYAFFSYKPFPQTGDLVVTAALRDIPGSTLSKSESMKIVKPELTFLDGADFQNMLPGEVKDISLRLRNVGSQVASSLSFNISPPFVLLPEQADSCKDRGILRSQEVCFLRVRYTRTSDTPQNGSLQVTSQPSFATAQTRVDLVSTNVQPATLTLSQASITFPQTQCGGTQTQEIYVSNTGSFDAVNVNITQPPPSVIGQEPYFRIILPPADSTLDPDLNQIVNCGTTFPAGRKCRIIAEFKPLSSSFPTTPVTGKINADGVAALTLSMNGTASAGSSNGVIPISVLDYNSLTPVTSMLATPSARVIVRVGPLTDSCNNTVANGTLVNANVSVGTLNNSVRSTNNGFADFIWNSVSGIEHLGTQTVNVTSSGFSNQGSLTLQGVNLALSGPISLGQVIIQTPQTFIYTITNSGNIPATNIAFSMTLPLFLVDQSTCASGVPAQGSCSFIVEARPTANQEYLSSMTISSPSIGANTSSITNILTDGKGKPILNFSQSKYLFNDGSLSGTISKIITLTNQGPSISTSTVFQIESPYTITSNSCGSSISVNQTCQINISVNRIAALNAGNKAITVNNQVELNTASATLAYTEISLGSALTSYTQYRCNGPLKWESRGDNNSLVNLSSDTQIQLSSLSGNLKYYSDVDCTMPIAQTSILAENSSSLNFYVRSFNQGEDQVSGSNPSLPVSSFPVVFQGIQGTTMESPQFAMRNPSFMLYHSSIKANVHTDFGSSTSTVNLYSPTLLGKGDFVDNEGYGATDTNGGESIAFGTAFIEGTIYVPKKNLNSASQTKANTFISSGKSTVGLNNGFGLYLPYTLYNSTASSVTSMAQYLYNVLFERTTSYLSFLASWGPTQFNKDNSVNTNNALLREINGISIKHPTSAIVLSFLDSPNSYKYYPLNGSDSLVNFGLINSKFYGNIDKDFPVVCDGDIFVDGPVYLQELKLETSTGCRIISSRSIFLKAVTSAVADRDGVDYINVQTNSNLQLSSSRGIFLGLGGCSSPNTMNPTYVATRGAAYANKYGSFGYNATFVDGAHFSHTLDANTFADYDLISDMSNNTLLSDADNCSVTYSNQKKVVFNRTLLNAPRIDSRYTGKFNGAIIGTDAVWEKGARFSHIDLFNQVEILPMLNPSMFFSKTDCFSATQQDLSTPITPTFRSCP